MESGSEPPAESKPVTKFYACILDRTNADDLWQWVDDPVAYLANPGRNCANGVGSPVLSDDERAVVLSMDEDRMRSRLVEEGNPPARSDLVARRLMKEGGI
jgi:hypothetical protein